MGFTSRLASKKYLPGCYNGNVIDLAEEWIKTLDLKQTKNIYIYACGTKKMLKSISVIAKKYNIDCQICILNFFGCSPDECICLIKNKDQKIIEPKIKCLNQREFLMINIKKNIIKIKESILNLELKLNREKNSVNLMAVSKMQNTTKIREAFNSGQKDFGENYLQESLGKISELSDLDITWHYIGKIQSNKSKLIAENYDWIQEN